ncbi:glycerophosphodiester phosphodiesterase [Agaribacter flavus]|uniref:glycerophosphodiester phosphodiesterase n=1 Tax=Agaribacter flavus TaxID=1902781 RepID=A0ABV7FN64_9ALTE
MRKLNQLIFVILLSHYSFTLWAFDIIAHRGASGFLPEHTKEALVLSYMQGADYIEQDLVATKDEQLIVLHDIHLETVTNVELLYPSRKRSDGRYYVIDFTLKELRRLQVHERTDANGKRVFPERYAGSGYFSIATFEEHIELIKELNKRFGTNTGFYPEIKSPEFHLSEGIDITKITLDVLNKHGLNSREANIYVQCFYPPSLKRIRQEFKSKVKLVQLLAENDWQESSANYDALKSQQGIEEVAQYADGIGPWLPQIFEDGHGKPKALLNYAKAAQLTIHPYTYRQDALFGNMSDEAYFNRIRSSGVDGLFTDHILPFMKLDKVP